MQKGPAGSLYRHIIRDAWAVVRANPVLWTFGFFVSFLGNGGVYELLVQGTGRLGLEQDFGGMIALAGILPSGPELWRALVGFGSGGILFVALTIAALGLLAVAVWVIVSNQGALIQGVRDCARGKKHSFASLFTAGNEVVAPLLLLNLVSRLVVSAFFYLLLSVLLLLLTKVTIISAVAYLLAFLVLIPLTVVIGFVTIYSAAYVTLHRMRLIEAVESAFALFLKHWLVSVEAAIVLFAINLLAAFALGLALAILAVIIFVIYGFTAAVTGAAAWILLLIGGVLAVGLIALTGAGIAAFEYAVWTELFLKFNRAGAPVAKIVRWFHKLA